LSMYGLVSLPAKVVEPMIALSIVYVAIENLVIQELKPWRLALVFSFGLLHGMGFAGVLRDLGLPRPQFLTALVSFNLGVEAGQLSVIAAAFLVILCWRQRARVVGDADRGHAAYHRFIVQPVSILIAAVGLFWTIQRALA
jgi:HupE/UreJ protein